MITIEMIKKLCPTGDYRIIKGFVKNFNRYNGAYGINTKLRAAHFIAQAAHESAHFRTLEEYATGRAYEGRQDLGNVTPGDGVKYKGRGIFQLTGRHNYKKFGGILLLNNPELASAPRLSVLTAMEYWGSHSLNDLADIDDVNAVTKRINGGYNGLEDRQNYLKNIKELLNG